MISVGDLKSIGVEVGYAEHRIRKLHLRKPNVAFDQALVPIENDEGVHYLMGLLMNEPFVSIYVEHEDNDNWVNMCNLAYVMPKVDNDVVQGDGLDELHISLSDLNFEPFNDNDVQSETGDEDIIMVKENVTNEKARRQTQIDLEKVVGCSEKARGSGNGGGRG